MILDKNQYQVHTLKFKYTWIEQSKSNKYVITEAFIYGAESASVH